MTAVRAGSSFATLEWSLWGEPRGTTSSCQVAGAGWLAGTPAPSATARCHETSGCKIATVKWREYLQASPASGLRKPGPLRQEALCQLSSSCWGHRVTGLASQQSSRAEKGDSGSRRMTVRNEAAGDGAAVDAPLEEVTVLHIDKVANGASVSNSLEELKLRWKPLAAPEEPEPVPVAEMDADTPTWASPVWASNIDLRRRIFCNRSLNMKSIVAVGFDMDYTLAQYRPDTFETMAYKETVKKLVHNLGYPKELLEWAFDWRYMVRGLVLDKRRGNILKMDRHKYVKVAYHGFREMSREERMNTYGNTLARESFDEPDYALIDTLFSLAEAYLFAQLVDYRDAHPDRLPTDGTSSYAGIYKDVRAAVDLCHRDGTLKQKVAADPGRYIYKDELLIPMLKMLRSSGRITFLVTNSLWDYTQVVMNYLCGKCGTTAETARDKEWLSLFDLVICGSAKPGFFYDGNRAPLFEVDLPTGMLMNTDSGTPLVQLGDVAPPPSVRETANQGCRVLQGGSVAHLHKMLKIAAGSQVLYVGDHIYGDILRSKKQLGWRTMLVVPELTKELKALRLTQRTRAEFHRLRQQRDALDATIQRLEWAIRFDEYGPEEAAHINAEVASLRRQRDAIREKHRRAMWEVHQQFHEVWGQLMKTGYQNSRFAHQVERFACLYTSHVGNLCFYSPDKSYRTSEDFMPHEFDVIDLAEAAVFPK